MGPKIPTNIYLVGYLLEQDRPDDAEKWIKITINSYGASYYINKMRKRLIGIMKKENDHDDIITLQSEILDIRRKLKNINPSLRSQK